MKAYLSYARPDRDLARRMVDGLRESGHEIWFDEFELTPGTGWGREIDKALKDSRAMIVLVSPESMKSKEVRREIEHALLSKNFAHRVLPVYVRPTRHVPWFFRSLTGVRVGTAPAKAFQQIKVALDRFEEQEEPVVQGRT
jgi:hypothetical protein